MRRFLTALTVVASTAIVSQFVTLAAAQEAPGPEAVRAAGDGSRFRVVQRIPATRRPVVESVKWPFPGPVRDAVEADDWAAAWKILEKVDPPQDERFGFLYGWVALQAGANERAEQVLAAVADTNGLLADYANLYAGEAAFRAQRHDAAAARAARVPSGSVPHRSASFLLGRALIAGKDSDKGIRALRAFIEAFPNDDDTPNAKVELARGLARNGDHLEAAKLLVDVRRRHPLWRGFDANYEAMEKSVLEKVPKKTRDELSRRNPEDLLIEHRVRFAAHQSETVIDALQKPVAKWKKKSPERCEGLYLVGNSYTKLRKHSDSVSWYENIIDECKGDEHYLKALYKGGKGYWNAGRKDDALRFYEKIWSEFPKHSYADDALYFAARILTEKEEPAKATKLLKRQVSDYTDGDMLADAHWLIVRDLVRKKDHKGVVAYVDAQSDAGETDLYSKGRMAYFRARALQMLGEERARAAYEAVVRDAPMGYYAFLALNRLAELGAGKGADVCELDGGAICAKIPVASAQSVTVDDDLQKNGSFQRGQAFLQVGLDGFAALEFKRLGREAGDDPDKLWALAALLDAAGAYPYSHDIARRSISGWEDQYPERERAVRWHIAYPTPFEDEVTQWAKKRGLPPEIIWAIMREESGFNPKVRSWAGAIGLMQVMPSTAKVTAAKDGLKPFDESALFDPSIAVRIGSAYLDDLAGRADEHPVLIIAGYNGGWGNVSRWLGEPESADLDLWVEDIPYGQTRDYTKRVLRSFWVYSWLHGDHRVPRFPMQVK